MPLPTFIVIGAQKAATTALWEYLREHPHIYLPDVKEPHFFIEEGSWREGLDWYSRLFEPGADRRHRGEVSPGYTFFPLYPGAPDRMKRILPDVRLIYLLRGPVDRMVSHYVQFLTEGLEKKPMRTALLYDSIYAVGSHYALQLEQYYRVFSREQVLVLSSDALRNDAGPTLDRILQFLELPIGWRPRQLGQSFNANADKRVPTAAGRLVARELRRRRLRRRPWAVAAMDRPPLSRPLTRTDLDLDPELRVALEAWLRPDTERLWDLVPESKSWHLLGAQDGDN